MADIGAESAAIVEDRDNTIRRVYYGKEGGSTAYKTYLEAKAIDPRIKFRLAARLVHEKCRKNPASRWSKEQLCGPAGLSRVSSGFVFHHGQAVSKSRLSRRSQYDRRL